MTPTVGAARQPHLIEIKPARAFAQMMKRMHYHYFTLEQRDALARVIRSRIAEAGMATALERLHAAGYGVCESCGGDIAFKSLLANPRLWRCVRCLAEL